MTITERIKHLVKKSSDQEDFEGLFLPKEIFRKIIDRERDRANRTGEVFSLVVFVLPDNGEKPEALALLTETLSQRMRSIDAIGWLDLQHVGILLPETNSEGAHLFARKISQEALTVKATLSYEIFTYPSEKLTDPQKIPLYVLSGKNHHKIRKKSITPPPIDIKNIISEGLRLQAVPITHCKG